MTSFLLKFPVRTFGKLLKPVERNYSDHVHPGYRRIKKIQEQFQHDDCLPVHLKRGLRDRLLYMFTLGFAGFCLLMDLKLYYNLAFPPKPQTKLSEDEEEKELSSKKEHGSKKEHEHDKKEKKGEHDKKEKKGEHKPRR